MIDLHAHLLPGLDDAPKEMTVILEMLSLAELDGITEIVATTHFAPGICTPTAEECRAKLAEVRAAAADAGLGITLAAVAHEVRAGAGVLDRVRHGELLALGGPGRYLLLESPSNELPEWLTPLVQDLIAAGVRPLLAHPERNYVVVEQPQRLGPLVQAGCLVQLTAGSFLGQFGGRVQATAEQLIRERLAHVVASDAHNDDDRAPILSHARTMIGRQFGEVAATALCEGNPRRVLAGEENITAPRPAGHGMVKRLLGGG